MRKIKTENPQLISLIRYLKRAAREGNAKIWSKIARDLSRPRNRRTSVNLSHINRCTKAGQTIAVPGKVLGAGILHHPVTITAFTFSTAARRKIIKSKGKCLTFAELIKKNPKGSNIMIVG
ncbi:MAG: 50S ribosomal protein L18e [Candidatus Bathyarchaeota archaeon]|nr:MAG: 50S ribosomal protein L18e [Candidatus Bathyarchaeota archaeon]